MTGVATAIGAAAVVGAGATAYAASSSASSAKNAQNIAQNQYSNDVSLESPYNSAGVGAQSQLNYLLGTGTPGQGNTASSSTAGGYGSLNAPFTTQMFQQYSPAYQFQLQQGKQGVLNGSASSQGALSGAALTGLDQYNQASANTAYNNAFNQYQTQQSNIYQRLANTAQLGQAAASGVAQQGSTLSGQAGQAAVGQGTAIANGATGVASSLGQGAVNGALYAQYGAGGSSNVGQSDYLNNAQDALDSNSTIQNLYGP